MDFARELVGVRVALPVLDDSFEQARKCHDLPGVEQQLPEPVLVRRDGELRRLHAQWEGLPRVLGDGRHGHVDGARHLNGVGELDVRAHYAVGGAVGGREVGDHRAKVEHLQAVVTALRALYTVSAGKPPGLP